MVACFFAQDAAQLQQTGLARLDRQPAGDVVAGSLPIAPERPDSCPDQVRPRRRGRDADCPGRGRNRGVALAEHGQDHRLVERRPIGKHGRLADVLVQALGRRLQVQAESLARKGQECEIFGPVELQSLGLMCRQQALAGAAARATEKGEVAGPRSHRPRHPRRVRASEMPGPGPPARRPGALTAVSGPERSQVDRSSLGLTQPQLQESTTVPRGGVVQVRQQQCIVLLPGAVHGPRFRRDVGLVEPGRPRVNARIVGFDDLAIGVTGPLEVTELLVQIAELELDASRFGLAAQLCERGLDVVARLVPPTFGPVEASSAEADVRRFRLKSRGNAVMVQGLVQVTGLVLEERQQELVPVVLLLQADGVFQPVDGSGERPWR